MTGVFGARVRRRADCGDPAESIPTKQPPLFSKNGGTRLRGMLCSHDSGLSIDPTFPTSSSVVAFVAMHADDILQIHPPEECWR